MCVYLNGVCTNMSTRSFIRLVFCLPVLESIAPLLEEYTREGLLHKLLARISSNFSTVTGN